MLQPQVGHQLEGGRGATHGGDQSPPQEDAYGQVHHLLTWSWRLTNWYNISYCMRLTNFMVSRSSAGSPQLQVAAGPGRDAPVRAARRGERPEARPHVLHIEDVDTPLCKGQSTLLSSSGSWVKLGWMGCEVYKPQSQPWDRVCIWFKHVFPLLDCVARGVYFGGERHQGLEQQDLQGQARLHQGGQAHQGAQKVSV